MGVKFADKAATTITGDIAADATSVTVASVSGFPTITGAGDYFYATIERVNDTTTYEVVKVTNLSSTTYTIDRSIESSSTFSAGDTFALRLNEHALVDPTLLDDAGITLSDNKKITLGTGGDLEIYHNGSHSFIADVGTGNLKLAGDEVQIVNSANNETKALFTTDGAVELYHNNSKKIETTSSGIDVTGEVSISDATNTAGATNRLSVGAGDDLLIYHNGDDSYIKETNGSGSLIIQGESFAIKNEDAQNLVTSGGGSVQLAHCPDASTSNTRLETTPSGITVTGTVTADALTMGDSEKITLGTGSDLEIYHDGSNSVITETTGTGDLLLRGNNLKLQKGDGGEDYLIATSNGSVAIKHDNNTKLETTTGGIDVTGTVTADGLTVDAGSSTTDLTVSSSTSAARLNVTSTATSNTQHGVIEVGGVEGGHIDIKKPSSDDYDVRLQHFNDAGSVLSGKTGDMIIRAETNGTAVRLQHEGDNTKLETTDTGIDVTGEVKGDSLNIDGNATFTSSDTSDQVIIENTDTSTNSAPDLKFKRSGSVGQASNIGVIAFDALNSTPANFAYANIVADATNITAGSETGKIKLQVHDPADGNNYPVPRLSVDKDGIDVTGTVTADGLILGDNESINLNTDLEIKSSSGTSEIIETGSGNLVVKAADLSLNDSNNFRRVYCTDGASGAVQLYYGDTSSTGSKLNTTNTGVNITGTLNADALTIDGDAGITGDVTIKGTSTADAATPTFTLERTVDDTAGVAFHDLGNIVAKGVDLANTSNRHTYAEIAFTAAVETAGSEAGRITFKTCNSGNNFGSEVASVRNDAFYAKNYIAIQTTGGTNRFTTLKSVHTDDSTTYTVNLPSASGTLALTSELPSFGITDDKAVQIDSTSVADNEYARFTANGLESRSTSEVLSDIGAVAASGDTTIAGVKTFSGSISGHITTTVSDGDQANLENFYGQRIIHTGDAHTYTLAATGSISGSDIGKSIIIINGGTDTITINVTTSEFFNMVAGVDPDYDDSSSGGASSVTVLKGGAAELIVTETNKILVFGSGVI